MGQNFTFRASEMAGLRLTPNAAGVLNLKEANTSSSTNANAFPDVFTASFGFVATSPFGALLAGRFHVAMDTRNANFNWLSGNYGGNYGEVRCAGKSVVRQLLADTATGEGNWGNIMGDLYVLCSDNQVLNASPNGMNKQTGMNT